MENKIKKEYKIKFLSHCFIGVIFLLIGVAEVCNIINIVNSSKAKVFFGMAFIAFSTSLGLFLNYYLLKKDSTSMEKMIVAESDERNIAVRNEVYAKTFLILKWIITYLLFTYTFLFPKEIFVSFGWWSLSLIFLSSMVMSGSIYIFVNKKY